MKRVESSQFDPVIRVERDEKPNEMAFDPQPNPTPERIGKSVGFEGPRAHCTHAHRRASDRPPLRAARSEKAAGNKNAAKGGKKNSQPTDSGRTVSRGSTNAGAKAKATAASELDMTDAERRETAELDRRCEAQRSRYGLPDLERNRRDALALRELNQQRVNAARCFGSRSLGGAAYVWRRK